MNRKSTATIPEAIVQLQRQFDQFRSTQPVRTKLPEPLWQAAVELAREHGVFDWLSSIAVRSAKGSYSRLFLLVYAVGTLVTVFMSNDATAVVLTPASRIPAHQKFIWSQPLTGSRKCVACWVFLKASSPARLTAISA